MAVRLRRQPEQPWQLLILGEKNIQSKIVTFYAFEKLSVFVYELEYIICTFLRANGGNGWIIGVGSSEFSNSYAASGSSSALNLALS